MAEAKTFYWISHGSPADPVWTYFLAGRRAVGRRTPATRSTPRSTRATCPRTRKRCAPRSPPAPTASSPPAPIRAASSRSSSEANAAGIPIININTPDPTASFDAYVGGDNVVFGAAWAQYLVDKGLVKAGDFVWMPVEVPGATYGVQEEEGIKSVFEPLGITWEVTDATLDQAEIITRMSDYLTANRDKIKAIIGLGDLVTGSIKRVFDQVGVDAGRNPGRRLGQLARHHAGSAGRATSTPRSGRTRRRPAMSACRSPRWRRAASRRLRRHHRRALREGHRADLRRHPVAASRSAPALRRAAATPPRTDPTPPMTRTEAPRGQAHRCCQRLIAKPEFGPLVLLVVEIVVFTVDQPGLPVAAQHLQHAGLHGRARPDRAGDDAADDRRRVRPLGRLGVRLRAGADVDAVQRRRRPRSRSASSSRSPIAALHRPRQRPRSSRGSRSRRSSSRSACCWSCAAPRSTSPTAFRSAPGTPGTSGSPTLLVGDFYIGPFRIYMSLFWFIARRAVCSATC